MGSQRPSEAGQGLEGGGTGGAPPRLVLSPPLSRGCHQGLSLSSYHRPTPHPRLTAEFPPGPPPRYCAGVVGQIGVRGRADWLWELPGVRRGPRDMPPSQGTQRPSLPCRRGAAASAQVGLKLSGAAVPQGPAAPQGPTAPRQPSAGRTPGPWARPPQDSWGSGWRAGNPRHAWPSCPWPVSSACACVLCCWPPLSWGPPPPARCPPARPDRITASLAGQRPGSPPLPSTPSSQPRNLQPCCPPPAGFLTPEGTHRTSLPPRGRRRPRPSGCAPGARCAASGSSQPSLGLLPHH